MRVLALTNMHPRPDDPAYGVFVRSQMNSVLEAGVHVDVRVIDGRRSPWEYAKAVADLRRRTRNHSYDIVHAHYGLSGFCAVFQPVPVIVSFCGDDLLGTPDGRGGITLKSRLHRSLSRLAARFASGIICKSEQLREALPRSVDRRRTHVIPNGVDVGLFRPGDRARARERLGINPGERIVLFPHAADVPRKRFDLAQRALAVLAESGVSARLLVTAKADHSLMPTYYQASDCLLLTSDQEGSPNTVKEALCCDLPVVTVDVGDVRQWVQWAPGSRLVVREADAIAAAIAELLHGPRRVDGARVRAELGLDRIARRIIDAYQEVLASRPRVRP